MIFGDEVHIKLINPRKKTLLFGLRTKRHAVVVTRQSQGFHTLKHTLLFPLFNTKCNHNLQIEHHATLKKTFKLVIKTMKTLGNCLLG